MASNEAPPRLFKHRPGHTAFALGSAAVLTVALAACGGGGSGSSGTTVTLGAEASLTGPGAAVGGPQLNGIQMAVDDINAAGGVKVGGQSVKLSLQSLDDQSKATLAVQNVQKMGRTTSWARSAVPRSAPTCRSSRTGTTWCRW
jgi:branched-chain amino acid transport system substrate-binding protein